MKQIRIHLEDNEVEVSELFELESYASALLIDFSGTGVENWDKFVDIETGDGVKHQVALGEEVAPFTPLSNLFTVKGTLLINPLAKMQDGDRTRVHAFKTYKFDVQETINAYGDGSVNKEDVIYPILKDIESLKATQIQDQIVHAEDIGRLETKDKLQDNIITKNRKDFDAHVVYAGTLEKRIAKNEEDIENLKGATIGEIGKHVAQIGKNTEDIVDIKAHDRYQDEKITELINAAKKKDSRFANVNLKSFDGQIETLVKGWTGLEVDTSSWANSSKGVTVQKEGLKIEEDGIYNVIVSNRYSTRNIAGKNISFSIHVNGERSPYFGYVGLDEKAQYKTTVGTLSLKKGDIVTGGVYIESNIVGYVSLAGAITITEAQVSTPLNVEYVPPAIIKDVTKNTADVKELQSLTLEQNIIELDKLDLNDYKQAGHFYTATSADTNRVTNKPTGLPASGFSMEVFSNGLTGVHQILKPLSQLKPHMYFRAHNAGVWGNWLEVSDKAEVDKKADKSYVDSELVKKTNVADFMRLEGAVDKKADPDEIVSVYGVYGKTLANNEYIPFLNLTNFGGKSMRPTNQGIEVLEEGYYEIGFSSFFGISTEGQNPRVWVIVEAETYNPKFVRPSTAILEVAQGTQFITLTSSPLVVHLKKGLIKMRVTHRDLKRIAVSEGAGSETGTHLTVRRIR